MIRPTRMWAATAVLFVLALTSTAPLQSQARTASSRPPARGALRSDTLWSQSLGIVKRMVVYLPPSYQRERTARYPVLYYLHGLRGSEDDWIRQARLDRVMDSLIERGAPEAIVVMPDGDDSWYTTWHALPDLTGCRADKTREEPAATFCVPWPHYDDYIARDLVAFVDSAFRTSPGRAHRAIGGLSMGGYGAITLALRYPDVFSAAASHSGVLAPALRTPGSDTKPPVWSSTPEELREAAGARYGWFVSPFGRDTIGWYARDPGRMAQRLLAAGGTVPAIFVDCGTSDPFLPQNRAFIGTLSALGLSYEYAELTGGHEWGYWRARLPHSLNWLLRRVSQP